MTSSNCEQDRATPAAAAQVSKPTPGTASRPVDLGDRLYGRFGNLRYPDRVRSVAVSPQPPSGFPVPAGALSLARPCVASPFSFHSFFCLDAFLLGARWGFPRSAAYRRLKLKA